jgi:hypothetical protein
MQNLVRLALLVCDIPAETVRAVDGDYPTMFKKLFESAAIAINAKLASTSEVQVNVTAFDATKSQLPSPSELSGFDALVLTGSSECFTRQVSC